MRDAWAMQRTMRSISTHSKFWIFTTNSVVTATGVGGTAVGLIAMVGLGAAAWLWAAPRLPTPAAKWAIETALRVTVALMLETAEPWWASAAAP
jgi:hypothetical protein